MRQRQAGFPPAQFSCLSVIDRRFFCHRFCGFHHRNHAAVHLGNQPRHARTSGHRRSRFLPRQHRGPMFFRDRTDGARGNRNPIMFFQLRRRARKRIICTQIGDGSLPGFRTPAALHFRRFGKRSNLRPTTTLGEDLLPYFDFSQSGIPVEVFFSFRLMPGLALYSCSFLCC